MGIGVWWIFLRRNVGLRRLAGSGRRLRWILDRRLVRVRGILVVDDNTDAAKSLAMLLSLSGYETEVRHDGRSALEAVEALTPDVVLLDLGLPDIDGYEVCRTLRRAEGPTPLTVVAVSGRGDDEARRLSREAGFDAHLLKPIAQTELMRVLKNV